MTMTTVARDFLDLRKHIHTLQPESVEDEVGQLITSSGEQPQLLTTLIGLHEIAYDFNGNDDVIGLLEALDDAIDRAPDADTQAYLGRRTTHAILDAFEQVDTHLEGARNIEHLAREATQFTDFIQDPRQKAALLFSISKAIAGSKTAYDVKSHGSSLFWDAGFYLGEAGKAAQHEENPNIRSRILAAFALQAVRYVEMAEIGGVIDHPGMGERFVESVRGLASRLFGEATMTVDADTFLAGDTMPATALMEIPDHPPEEKNPAPHQTRTITATMAYNIVHRLISAQA